MDLMKKAREVAMQALLDILYTHQAARNHDGTVKIALLILEVTK